MSASLIGPSIGGQILSPEFRSSGFPSGPRGFAITTCAADSRMRLGTRVVVPYGLVA
jgi:hypothetical protein